LPFLSLSLSLSSPLFSHYSPLSCTIITLLPLLLPLLLLLSHHRPEQKGKPMKEENNGTSACKPAFMHTA